MRKLQHQSDLLNRQLGVPVSQALSRLDRLEGRFRVLSFDEDAALEQAEWLIRRVFCSSAVPQDDGLRLLQTSDPLGLSKRIQTVDYLAGEYVPTVSIKQLNLYFQQFLDFQTRHAEFLVRTGLPPLEFTESRWLYLHLGRMYDTRRTTSPFPMSELWTTTIQPEDEHPEDGGPRKWLYQHDHPEVLAKPYTWVRQKK